MSSHFGSRPTPATLTATPAADPSNPVPAGPRHGILRPIPADRRPRRLARLGVGLFLFSFSLALQIRANLGLGPWDVFHLGVTRHVPITIGLVSICTAAAVLLGWIPLRERPGLGTVTNVVLVGALLDLCLWFLPEFRPRSGPLTLSALIIPALALAAGIVLNALAGALYIGAGLGPGPRDGLMTGLVKRTGGKVGPIRIGIEVTVLAVGWLLGGPVGVGTVLYAVAIGPLLHVMMPWFDLGGDNREAKSDPTVEAH